MRRGLIAIMLALLTGVCTADDWPDWRGPNRDAVSTETDLLTEWDEGGPPLAWMTTGIGAGYSGVVVADNRIYTLGESTGQCVFTALDYKSGNRLWSTYVDNHRPNATPLVDGDLAFALGYKGNLVAVKSATGEELWRINLHKAFRGKTQTDCGYSESPLVDGDRLVCTPGGKDAAVVALNKYTGTVMWKSTLPEGIGERGADGSGYSSIVVSTAAGVRHYVVLTGRGALGISPKDGVVLWTYNRVANEHANVATPIVHGDFLFFSTAYQTGSALVKMVRNDAANGDPSASPIRAEEVYFLAPKVLQNHHGGLVRVGDHIYGGHGHNKGFPVCVEVSTGTMLWEPQRGPGSGSAAVMYADGHLYFHYENGVMALIEADPTAYKLKGSFKVPGSSEKSWSHPVISGGRLFIREENMLHCYDVRRPQS